MKEVKIINLLTRILVALPVYPHWLSYRNCEKGNQEIRKFLFGKVIETGCGNLKHKELALKTNKKITEYIATDHSSWDDLYTNFNKLSKRYGRIANFLFGNPRKRKNLDKICDALNLPFQDAEFDSYCSYEVLEHINEPNKFFQEAYRVLKPGGVCILALPFIFREHGGPQYDFQRLTRGGLKYLANKNGLKLIYLKTHSFFGTTIAALTNQYLIRKICESNPFIKIFLFLLSPFVFTTFNIIGYCIDSIDHDIRFANRYHIVFKKV